MPESEIIFAVEESPEGGYEARTLDHPIFTQADTLDELKTMLRDAVACHFDAAAKPHVIGLPRLFPDAARLEFSKIPNRTIQVVGCPQRLRPRTRT